MQSLSKCVLVWVAAVATLVGCVPERDSPTIRSGHAVQPECDASAAAYPAGAMGAPLQLENRTIATLSPFLAAAELKPLWCGPQLDGFRVVWISANRPVRLAVLTQSGADWNVVGALFDDPRRTGSDRPPATIAKQVRKVVAPDQIISLQDLVEANQAWTVAPWKYSIEAADGDLIALELRSGGSYRVITRTRVRDERVEEIAQFLLTLAGLRFDRDN